MENNLILRKDVEKERFNSQKFEVTELRQFLAYYMLILEFATTKLKVINNAEKEAIHKLLISTIAQETENSHVLIANHLYVITLWLTSLENWDAWLQINRAKEYLYSQIGILE